jgi:PTH1 family peptidyl-tRNA hydrolase
VELKLIVGLGNPGPRYAKNRHNVGYQVVGILAQRHQMTFARVMFKACVTTGSIAGERVVLTRPLTFMNLSGQTVRPLLRWYHLDLSELLVIHDDLDLPLGRIRLREHGGSGGHKGMRSIIQSLSSEEFPRLRVGIGRPLRGEPQDYVLQDFTAVQLITMEEAYDRAAAAAEHFVGRGIVSAMSEFNRTVQETVD